jgi:glycosyltransferase involved in cell wall biosynthesis
MTDRFDVIAVVPHAHGALAREVLDGVMVLRYRYAPARLETLVNDGGIVTNLRRSAWKWLLVPGFIAMQWVVARRHITTNTVVHAHWIVPQGAVARALHRPFVVTSHGADLFALKGRLAVAAKRHALAACAALTVVSQAMREFAAELLPPDRITVRPMGVDLRGLFTPDSSVQRKNDRLLFVGRLVEKKGVDVLLRAMSQVIAARPSARLTLVGHGPLEASLRTLAAAEGVLDHVDFAGPRAQRDLPALYRAASVFVAPFREAVGGDREGLGLVLVEALGCGCPVVASDMLATRDVLAGVRGVDVVPPGDVGRLASALLNALDESALRSSHVSQDRQHLIDRFDWEAVAVGYADLITNVGNLLP